MIVLRFVLLIVEMVFYLSDVIVFFSFFSVLVILII